MRNLFSYLVSGATLATTLLTMNACSGEDFSMYNGDLNQAIVKENYTNAFVDIFGEINPNQSWDFSSVALAQRHMAGTLTSSNRAATRAAAVLPAIPHNSAETAGVLKRQGAPEFTGTRNSAPDGWYRVPDNTTTWLNNNLREGQNNYNRGVAFELEAHGDFLIIPIYQGEAGQDFDLHLVDNSHDYYLWTESQGLIGSNDGTNWTALGTEWSNSATTASRWRYAMGRPMLIHGDRLDGPFSLYLHVTRGHPDREDSDTNQKQSSHDTDPTKLAQNGTDTATGKVRDHMMISLPLKDDFITLSQIKTSFNRDDITGAMVIGCEDSNKSQADWDMNDVVFLIVGYPTPPTPVHNIKKRYMIEDLGSFDFDFNDIVVDVTETYQIQDNGTTQTMINKSQKAEIKWLCGTLPFVLQVGDTEFPVIQGQNGGGSGYDTTTDPDYATKYTMNVEGWDPAANNVQITVSKNQIPNSYEGHIGASGNGVLNPNNPADRHDFTNDVNKVAFPDNGEAPMMIAVDPKIQPMPELVTVPNNWWVTWEIPEDDPDTPTQDDDTVTLPWTGSQKVTWAEHIKVNKSSFTDVKVGDKISVTLSNSTSFKLCINIPGNWTEFATYNSNSCEYTIQTQGMVDNLKTYGLEIQGQDAILISIRISSGSSDQGGTTTLWTGERASSGWGAQTINSLNFGSVTAANGDKLVFTTTNGGSAAGFYVKLGSSDTQYDYKILQNGNYVVNTTYFDEVSNNVFTLKLNSDMATALNNNHQISFSSNQVTVTKIELVKGN